MARGRGFQRPHRSPRRRTAWSVGPNAILQSAASAPSQLFTNGVALSASDNVTIGRLRGEAMVYLSAGSTAISGYDGAFGIGIVSAEAFAAGAASCPDANVDADDDIWLYHQFFHVKITDATAGDLGQNAVSKVQRFTVDSKAMRKVNADQVIFGSFGAIEVGAATVNFDFDSRLLFLLH